MNINQTDFFGNFNLENMLGVRAELVLPQQFQNLTGKNMFCPL